MRITERTRKMTQARLQAEVERMRIYLRHIENGHRHPECFEIHSSPDCRCGVLWAKDALR